MPESDVITVNIPLTKEERKELEDLSKLLGETPDEIITDDIKRRLAYEIHRAATEPSERKTPETVNVTLIMPKSLVEFLQAAITFTKLDTTVEDLLLDTIENGIVEVLKGQRINETLPGFEGEQLVKAYKLGEIDC